jgi:N-methylhydantoinase B
VREPDQVVGDIYSLASCNAAGDSRLQSMMDEFKLSSLQELADFIIDNSREATRKRIAELTAGSYDYQMTVDGYEAPVTMQVRITVEGDRLLADFDGTSGLSTFGVNCPMVYTRAYACYGLKCAIAPEVPNNFGSIEPFEITAPAGCILAAERPAPVSVRHVLGHLVPDAIFGALHQCLPDRVPAEGASALWNIQMGARPIDPSSGLPNAEVLMFNSGGTGARPALDGLSATAFPSGVSTMSVEATEHVGPITVWRKELSEGSGGPGQFRGGLGQTIEIEAREGYQLSFNAMFDRIDNPAAGRNGGLAGAPGAVLLDDGTRLKGKGHQKIPAGKRLVLHLPGGGGYGDPKQRPHDEVQADLRGGYITEDQAREVYALSNAD